MFGIGAVQHLDTYLSPLHYNGVELRATHESEHIRQERSWSTITLSEGWISSSMPENSQSAMLSGAYRFAGGRLRAWHLAADRLQLQAGLMGDLNIGVDYLAQNGNNPAQARLSANVVPMVTANYQLRLFRRNMSLRYEAQAPLLGAMFSPQFGQTYYEIFTRGNYDHNVVFTSAFHAPSLRQQLTIDIPIHRHALRVGYLGDYRQALPNGLKQHKYTHAIVIGWRR